MRPTSTRDAALLRALTARGCRTVTAKKLERWRGAEIIPRPSERVRGFSPDLVIPEAEVERVAEAATLVELYETLDDVACVLAARGRPIDPETLRAALLAFVDEPRHATGDAFEEAGERARATRRTWQRGANARARKELEATLRRRLADRDEPFCPDVYEAAASVAAGVGDEHDLRRIADFFGSQQHAPRVYKLLERLGLAERMGLDERLHEWVVEAPAEVVAEALRTARAIVRVLGVDEERDVFPFSLKLATIALLAGRACVGEDAYRETIEVGVSLLIALTGLVSNLTSPHLESPIAAGR